jgi:flagellar basal-body rod modification protein FlgD
MTSTAVAPTNTGQIYNSQPPASSTSGASSTSSASSNQLSLNNGLASLATNFQGFLTLLTTQLQNQDPTSPLDTNQFTQQITSMTGVEQQLLSNQLLTQLVNQQTGVGAAANLIGDTVSAPGATSSAAAITGTVTAVSQSNGQTMLTVGGAQVPLSSLTSVTSNANSLSSLLGS